MPPAASPLHARHLPRSGACVRASCDLGNRCIGRREWTEISMTVLVTGGAGYIGSHMVHDLVDSGERVVVLDNLVTGFDWAVPAGATLVVGSTGDQPLVTSLIGQYQVEAIIHFAASVVVPESVADP